VHVRAVSAEIGLESLTKTTGGTGLHIVAPIERRTTWDDAKAFARGVADFLVAHKPAEYTSNLSKAARRGRIFVDYLRNGRGATAVAPYSTRAKQHATVATPVSWQEVAGGVRADAFDTAAVVERIRRQRKDPWAAFFDIRQSITKAMMRRLAK
jgi:bifunctional non-homologous end joining protein LigD